MIRRNAFLALAATAAFFTLGATLPGAAHAQNNGGGQGRRGGFGQGRMMGGMSDPTHSNEAFLLQRADVRTELQIDAGQREKLDETMKTAMQEAGQKIGASMREFFQNNNTGKNPQDMDQEERAEFFQKMQAHMQEQMGTVLGEANQKLEAVLNKRQIKRLHELDLQWRGPLALGDKTVVEPFKLTSDQKTKLDEIVKKYRADQMKAMMSMRPGGRPGGDPNADPNAPPMPPTPEQMKKRQEEMQKAADKMRSEAGDKVTELLTAEQKTQWTAMLGKPFKFKTETAPAGTQA